MCELGKPHLARRTRGALAARFLKLRHAHSLGGRWGQLRPCWHPGGFLEAELGERVLEGGAGGGGVFQAPSDPAPLPGILLPLCSKRLRAGLLLVMMVMMMMVMMMVVPPGLPLPSASPPREVFTGTRGQHLEKPRPPLRPPARTGGRGHLFLCQMYLLLRHASLRT